MLFRARTKPSDPKPGADVALRTSMTKAEKDAVVVRMIARVKQLTGHEPLKGYVGTMA